MKKMLITSNRLDVGGIQVSLIRLLKYLNTLDNIGQIDLVLKTNCGILMDEIPTGVNVCYIDEKYGVLTGLRKWFSILFPKRYLKRRYSNLSNATKYDFAIAYDGTYSDSDYYAYYSNAKSKFIWVHNDLIGSKLHAKGVKSKYILRLRKNKLKLFDNIVCVSDNSKNSYLKFIKSNKQNIQVINNFFDEKDVLTKSRETIDYSIDFSCTNFICIARLAKVKNFQLLIEGFYLALKRDKNIKLYIIGDGPERENILDLIRSYSIEQKVILLGEMKNPFPYLKMCDKFVLASDHEGYSMAPLEALALGKQVIIKNASGLRDIYSSFNKNEECILFENDKNSLSSAIVKSLTNKNEILVDFDDYNECIKEKLQILLT